MLFIQANANDKGDYQDDDDEEEGSEDDHDANGEDDVNGDNDEEGSEDDVDISDLLRGNQEYCIGTTLAQQQGSFNVDILYVCKILKLFNQPLFSMQTIW